jgi:ribosomal 50S subunit-associated protein YjgA (DUF615 family)
MNIYQALRCLVDETANEEKQEEARAELRQFLDKIEHVEDLATDPDRQPLDTFPLLTGVLAEEGICVMLFCNAADVREALAQQALGDLARKLPNAQIIQKLMDTVRAKGGKLPAAFEAWRAGIISGAARSFVQDLLNAWPEAPGSRIRFVRRKHGHSQEPEAGGTEAEADRP